MVLFDCSSPKYQSLCYTYVSLPLPLISSPCLFSPSLHIPNPTLLVLPFVPHGLSLQYHASEASAQPHACSVGASHPSLARPPSIADNIHTSISGPMLASPLCISLSLILRACPCCSTYLLRPPSCSCIPISFVHDLLAESQRIGSYGLALWTLRSRYLSPMNRICMLYIPGWHQSGFLGALSD